MQYADEVNKHTDILEWIKEKRNQTADSIKGEYYTDGFGDNKPRQEMHESYNHMAQYNKIFREIREFFDDVVLDADFLEEMRKLEILWQNGHGAIRNNMCDYEFRNHEEIYSNMSRKQRAAAKHGVYIDTKGGR